MRQNKELRDRFVDPPLPAGLEPDVVMQKLRSAQRSIRLLPPKGLVMAAAAAVVAVVSFFALPMLSGGVETENLSAGMPQAAAASEQDGALFDVYVQEKSAAETDSGETVTAYGTALNDVADIANAADDLQEHPSAKEGCLKGCTEQQCLPECPNYQPPIE